MSTCDLNFDNDSFDETGWDRAFLLASSNLAEPVARIYEEVRFGLLRPWNSNYPSIVQEVAYRALLGVGAALAAVCSLAYPLPVLFTAALYTCSIKILRAAGFTLQKGGFSYVRSSAPEKPLSDELKIMTWNICGAPGGSFPYGGVPHWRERIDKIVELIEKEDPDVLLLQEIYDTDLGEALIEKLSARYAHIYDRMGPNIWGLQGGIMMLSKISKGQFSHTSFDNNRWYLHRGFASLEFKNDQGKTVLSVKGTHFIDGIDQDPRKRQFELVRKTVSPGVPTLIIGDLNVELRNGEAVFSSHLVHGYQGEKSTCTSEMAKKWDGKDHEGEEIIDYISLFAASAGNTRIEDCRLIDTFDRQLFDPKTALSDHCALVATIRGFM